MGESVQAADKNLEVGVGCFAKAKQLFCLFVCQGKQISDQRLDITSFLICALSKRDA
jgi:hypothetical protein